MFNFNPHHGGRNPALFLDPATGQPVPPPPAHSHRF
jgi:hypothetical protein